MGVNVVVTPHFKRLVAVIERFREGPLTTGAPEHTVRHVPPQATVKTEFLRYDNSTVKGKPCESRGRKVIGLKGASPRAAGLPVEVGCWMQHICIGAAMATAH